MYALRRRGVVARGVLSPGRSGTEQTLFHMRRLVADGARSLAVRHTALEILKRAGVRPHDFLGELRALFEYVRDGVRFTRDPVKIELLQTPDYTLRETVGDCDDKSVLLASLLRAVGHPARLKFRAIGTHPQKPEQFSHVYVVAQLGNRQLAMDPTRAGTALGWEYSRPTVRKDVPV
jgi:transglutaminase-like putative cysteine protease